MYKIDINKLEDGDIFLTRSNDRESELIRKISNSDYSHAILYVGVSSCIESDGLGVQSQNVNRLLFENKDDFVVLRLKNKSNLQQAIDFARQKIGTEYSTSEAKIARLERDLQAKEENRQFCTRLISQAYANANINLVENIDYCSPKDLQNSDLLFEVIDVALEASQKDIDYVNSEDKPLEKQIEIHNFIFENARNITGEDIQNFEQLGNYLIRNQDKDEEITEMMKKSGYFEMWKMDTEKNPWHYDILLFKEHYKNPNQQKKVGHYFASTEENTRDRFIRTLNSCEQAFEITKLTYFKAEVDLCKKLIELSEQRELTGKLALL